MIRTGPADRLAVPGLAPLVDALVRRYGAGDDPAAVHLRGLDVDAQEALADLLGEARRRGASTRVPVARVVAALRLRDAAELRAAVEHLRGPVADRRAARADAVAERDALLDDVMAAVAGVDLGWDDAGRAAWLERVRVFGPRGGVDRHRERLRGVVEVLRRLPADGVPLPALAAESLGDPHGLDRGRTVAALVLDALVHAGLGDPPRDAEAARRLWEAAGVAPDPLSSTVLVLGLRPEGDDPLAAFLRASAGAGEPAVVTLAQLRRWPVAPLPADAAAFIVENPSLVVDAAARGIGGAVLVCSSGRPTVAVVTLLRQLGAAAAVLHQHADFDAQGLGITAWLAERAGTRPWLMDAAAYRSAVDAAAATRRERVPLGGVLPATPWDPPLRAAMLDAGRAVFEEQVRGDLLDAIAGHTRVGGAPRPR